MMLLEVLIAFALIVLCAMPLIAPHVAMLKAQREFIKKVDLDHAVNLLYASVLEQLYLNGIAWNDLMQNVLPVSEEEMQRLGYASFPYEGSYNFTEIAPRYKPRDPNAPYSLYLFTLTFNFVPKKLSKASDEVKQQNLFKYRYEVFVVRDRRSSIAQESDKDEKK